MTDHNIKDLTGMQIQNRLGEYRYLLKRGEMTYEKVKEVTKPLFDELNRRGREISKGSGRKFTEISFTRFMH